MVASTCCATHRERRWAYPSGGILSRAAAGFVGHRVDYCITAPHRICVAQTHAHLCEAPENFAGSVANRRGLRGYCTKRPKGSPSMPELPGGTLTVLHTEIEASTSLTVHLGDRYPGVLATHRALLRAAFAAHEGHEVDTQGDSFFVVFPRATQAAAAAVARGNRFGRRRGTRDWTSSGARASGTPATAGRCCCPSRPPP